MPRTLLALILALSACNGRSDAAPAAPTTAENAQPMPEPEPQEAPKPSAPLAPIDVPAAPAAGCAFGAPTLVQSGEGWADVAALGAAFAVGGVAVEGEREEVFVARVEGDGARVVARGALEHPVPRGHRRAGLALAEREGRLALAVVDGRRRLMLGEVQGSGLSWRVIAEGASLRFAPALSAFENRWAIAWTVEEPALRVRAALVGDTVEGQRELQPAGGGSAAPAFVAAAPSSGSSESSGGPSLIFLDPRAGISVVHRSALGPDGFGEPTVVRPLNLVTEPPALAIVRASGTEWIAYTAIGSAATTAVGLARLDGLAPPVALVPGTGYGVLHVDAAPFGEEGAVFVADAPRASEPDAPRELHVRTLSADGALGDPTVVQGPSKRASRGRIAHADGVVAVSFRDPEGLHVATGRCAIP